MQWSKAPHAGFTSRRPWLPVSPTYAETNVEVQRGDAHSMLALYRKLIALRRGRDVLVTGAKRLVDAPDDVVAYERHDAGARLLVVLNLGQQPRQVVRVRGTLLLSTHLDREGERIDGTLELRADEGAIVDAVQ
jgi:alpha-glucosidase